MGHEDNVKHFYSLLPAFKDKRYMTVDGKLIFVIYKPFEFDVSEFIQDWQQLAAENGLKGFYFIALLNGPHWNLSKDNIVKALTLGFDAVNTVRLGCAYSQRSFCKKVIQRIYRILPRMPILARYEDAFPQFIAKDDEISNVYPTIIPNWDHTPRSGRNGYVLIDSTPELFRKHIRQVLDSSWVKKNMTGLYS